MNIEMRGYADVRADARTVKDLRDLVSFLNENRVRDDVKIDWSSGFVYVLVVEDTEGDFIECGEHMGDDRAYHVLLETHSHDDDDGEVVCEKCGGESSDNVYHLHRGKYLCVACFRKQLPENYEEALEMSLDG